MKALNEKIQKLNLLKHFSFSTAIFDKQLFALEATLERKSARYNEQKKSILKKKIQGLYSRSYFP